jgi:DNA replication protein DnaC
MTEELEQLLKNLKLRRILEIYDEQLRAADKDGISYSEFVTRLVRAQFQAKQEGALEWRIRRANLPERWTLETFPFARQPGVNRKQIRGFGELDFIAKAENIVLVGKTGVGKTGLACGLLLKALENGYRCQFIRAQDLFDEMYASLADRSDASTAQAPCATGRPSDRRARVLKSQTRAVEHLLQADGGALPPAFHHHHYESRV